MAPDESRKTKAHVVGPGAAARACFMPPAQDESAERPAKEKARCLSALLLDCTRDASGQLRPAPRSVDNVIAAAGTVIAAVQLQQAKRDSERAFRESPEGRLQEAVRRMMRPHEPAKGKEQVVARKAAVVIQDTRDRISSWQEHATVVTGRYGSGKSVAVHEELHLDGPGMLKELFNRVAAELQKDFQAPSKVPVLVLDILRETTQGMPLVSNFAKELSTDKMGSAVHVIVCASSAGTAMTFDAGGAQRQACNIWVEDLAEQEAQQLLELKGHAEDWKQFTAACGFNALDLVKACGDYTGPDFLEEARRKKEATAHMEVLCFREQCKFQTVDSIAPAGANILKALLVNRKGGDGQGVAALSAGTAVGPKKVAQWMRQEGCHPVIWHTREEKYKFASERHAQAAAAILNRRWWPL
ncbi:unnamed protein product [Symbiodinium pilosum]|uniref:Uncharacterized protein n=1 Tax=Symbiodinium pilosum TaxID=2952 RepID=A0A812T4E6_SYMPI|nr:unnamed protein product [Symbiodinium pilosum]